MSMSVNRIVVGYAVQVFDPKTGECTDQYFIAGDEESWEGDYGEAVDKPDCITTIPQLSLKDIR